MIALITSTITVHKAYSYFSNEERMEQTLITIQQLHKAGFDEIYLFDNSSTPLDIQTLNTVSDKLHLSHAPQYTFQNKGLNEALLILNNIDSLPADKPIFKISGRYYPTEKFRPVDLNILNNKDVAALGYEFNTKKPSINTRAYYIKNKQVFEQYLVWAVEEMISYSKGIHGAGSFLEAVLNHFRPKVGTSYQLSLEQAMGHILKAKDNYHLLGKLNIEGFVAGSDFKEFISE